MDKSDFAWDDVIRMAGQAGAVEGIKEFKRLTDERQSMHKDKRFHNTKLLLKHYRDFREHVKNSVYSDEQLTQDADEILNLMNPAFDDEVYISSIKRTRKRTEIIVAHIDSMLQFYLHQSENNPQKKARYKTIEGIYIHGKTPDEVSAQIGITSRNVYRAERLGIEDLSILLFGIDGLKIER